jgi:hypothetical protein
MIYTAKEYAASFTFQGKTVSEKTVKRRCAKNYLPPSHKAVMKGNIWIIEIKGSCGNCKMFRRSNIFREQGRCTNCDPVAPVMEWMSCEGFKC